MSLQGGWAMARAGVSRGLGDWGQGQWWFLEVEGPRDHPGLDLSPLGPRPPLPETGCLCWEKGGRLVVLGRAWPLGPRSGRQNEACIVGLGSVREKYSWKPREVIPSPGSYAPGSRKPLQVCGLGQVV